MNTFTTRSRFVLVLLFLMAPLAVLGESDKEEWVPDTEVPAGKVRYVWAQLCKSEERIGRTELRGRKVDLFRYIISYGYADAPPGTKYDAIASKLPSHFKHICPPQKTMTNMYQIAAVTYVPEQQQSRLRDKKSYMTEMEFIVFELLKQTKTYKPGSETINGAPDMDLVTFWYRDHVQLP